MIRSSMECEEEEGDEGYPNEINLSDEFGSGQEDDNNNYISEIHRRCQNDNEVRYRAAQNEPAGFPHCGRHFGSVTRRGDG